MVGPEAKGLSANVVGRLKRQWEAEYKDWCARSLNDDWVYVWADGIYSGLRGDEGQLCCLVIIGVNRRGQKHFLAIEDGVRESKQSWREVLVSLKQRGLKVPPKLAIGDGALGFWAALEEIYPETRTQRCWMHKTGNVLNYLPKSVQPKAKQALHEIWMAEGRAEAEKAFDVFIDRFEAKYPKAVECLKKDRASLLAFYDFPAEHWIPHPHDERPRVQLRYDPASLKAGQGLRHAQHDAGNDLQDRAGAARWPDPHCDDPGVMPRTCRPPLGTG